MKSVFKMGFVFAGLTVAPLVYAAEVETGKSVYESTCSACHSVGAAGAPKFGDKAAWAPRIKVGLESLYQSALNGKNVMPPRGGNSKLSDAEVKAAVDYMVSKADDVADKAPEKAAEPVAKEDPVKKAAEKPAVVSKPVNISFNRLMKKQGKRNASPMEDGIHDPSNDGTASLQPPLEVFDALPKSNFGNFVDWVASIREGKINPRADRTDASKTMTVMDLNIERRPKGSMPIVVYPHKQHTEWLDCSNCHPAIFVPQKGANQISMAAILLGQKCGVCHGKVSFPVSTFTCSKCHSKAKEGGDLQLTRSPTAVAADPSK